MTDYTITSTRDVLHRGTVTGVRIGRVDCAVRGDGTRIEIRHWFNYSASCALHHTDTVEARAMPAIIRNYATGVEIRPATTRESERYFEIAGTLPVIDGQASAVEGLDVAYDLDCMIYIDPPAAAIVPRDA